jgi:DNA-directed RNA polymerase specialized sigma24 family protein
VARTPHPDHFTVLLVRLAPDRNAARERYADLCRRLRTVFQYRGCPNPDELVSEVLDRAGGRLQEMGDRFEESDPGRYVFGVAWDVARESFRRPPPEPVPERKDPADPGTDEPDEFEKLRSTCLDRCLSRLPEDDRDVVSEYYRGERRVRIQRRAALARDLALSPNALRLKVHFITRRMRRCVSRCVELGGMRPRSFPGGPRLAKS